MSFNKVVELSEEFRIKLAEKVYDGEAPPNVKAKDLDWIDEETRQEIRENGKNHEYIPFDKSHNPPGAIASEKTWDKAKKAVKKYWKKYDEPWAVVYHVYKNMGGKPKKKSKKKTSELISNLLQKYAIYGHIPNTTPPQNQVQLDSKQIATQAVYNLIKSLYAEKQQGRFAHNPELENSYNKISEFYHSLLQEGKRAKFELYDEAISDPTGFSILEEENQLSVRGGPRPTKLDRMLTTKNEVLSRHLEEANEAVRALKQETRS